MRHGDKIKNLSRTKSHRKALLKNLTIALIQHKGIVTTLAKAKALRVHVEPLLTKTKGITTQELMTARQRLIFAHLQNEDATKELFTVVAPKIADRPGGYCRIVKLGPRKTDSAEMAYIELVDFNEVNTEQQQSDADVSTAKPKAKRTRRSKSSATTQPVNDVKEENVSTSVEEPKANENIESKAEEALEVAESNDVLEDKQMPTEEDKEEPKKEVAPIPANKVETPAEKKEVLQGDSKKDTPSPTSSDNTEISANKEEAKDSTTEDKPVKED